MGFTANLPLVKDSGVMQRNLHAFFPLAVSVGNMAVEIVRSPLNASSTAVQHKLSLWVPTLLPALLGTLGTSHNLKLTSVILDSMGISPRDVSVLCLLSKRLGDRKKNTTKPTTTTKKDLQEIFL